MTKGQTSPKTKTYYASPERSSADELRIDIERVGSNPVITGLLNTVGGLLAVLNEHRQVVALNEAFLAMLGIENAREVLGLRPGETISCIHSREEPGGCGTSRYCSTCGAAIAIVACLDQEVPVEKKCALTASRGGQEVQLALAVRAIPIRINDKCYVLLFLQDITLQEQRAALERTFFHDVNNMLSMLVQAGELLVDESPSTLSSAIYEASIRLSREVAMQRCLFEEEGCSYMPVWRECDAGQILQELRVFFSSHKAGKGKVLQFPATYQRILVKTDGSSLFRVLLNMIVNALEATQEGGVVRVWVEYDGAQPVFCVWNSGAIPPEVALRIFQRNFSTKGQPGRGVGTYSMKLFGEQILGGKVSFTSSEEEGTTFRFMHPGDGPRRDIETGQEAAEGALLSS